MLHVLCRALGNCGVFRLEARPRRNSRPLRAVELLIVYEQVQK
jgi:hypothetical protein